ncbi:MAG: hypothetical protein HYZ54_12345 [Ignavibacteriae bacterium]|nr:hypothetical protein [Ignavibacteriota bacterium]
MNICSSFSATLQRYFFASIICSFALISLIGCGGMNGVYIEPSNGQKGLSSLKINNGYDQDIVVKLSDVKDPSKTLHYMFVSANSSATIKDIAPGNLTMKYSKGLEWDKAKKMFSRERANFESDQIFKFEETETETETSDGKVKQKNWTVQSFTLNPGIGAGNTTVSQIKDEEFNDK